MLTHRNYSTMLSTAGNKSARPINPEKQGVKTPLQGVFYCPKKITAHFVRAIIMVARSGLLKSGPEPCPGVDNPLRATAQNLSTFGGGLYLRQGVTA